MPGRKYQQGNSKYRYGQNGQERDKELNENIYTAEYWEYDSRIGRRWNVDPVDKEEESPYLCFNGNPISNSDKDGDDAENVNDNEEPDDEFIKYKDGSFRRVGSKGGNVYDIIYYSNFPTYCVPCLQTQPNEKLTRSLFTYHNPAMNEDGNYYSRVSANERIEPGVWATEWVTGEDGLESIDLTDFIPSKAVLKVGAKAALGVVLRKATVNTVERKVETTVLKAAVKKTVSANSKASAKAQTIYGLEKQATKKIEKVGISSGKLDQTGIPYRANRQVNKVGKDNYKAVVLDKQAAGKNARAKGLKKEIKHTNANAATINPDLHQRPKPKKSN